MEVRLCRNKELSEASREARKDQKRRGAEESYSLPPQQPAGARNPTLDECIPI